MTMSPEEVARFRRRMALESRYHGTGVKFIEPDEITGADLCVWHVVEVECEKCHHTRVVKHETLKWAKRQSKRLTELNWRCRAKPRHETAGVDIRVFVMPRNT